MGNLSSAKSFLDPRQVSYLIFYVTNRCNFRCKFCFYYAEIEKGRKPNELSLDEIDRFSRQLGPLLQLSLTGGEPFLRKDLAELTHIFIRNCDPRYITIPTNASLTDRMVRFLEDVLPQHPNTYLRLTFSIDGIGDDHDEARSMPGSYEKIRASYAAISPLRARFPNLVLDANSVFTARSEDRILETMRRLHADFQFDNLSITYARGDVKDPTLKTDSRDKYVEVNEYLESIRRTKENRFLYPVWRGVRDVSRQNLIRTVFDDEFVTPCVAGRKLLVISETGEVHPCEILDSSMGNLREVDFDVRQLLKRKESRELVDWIKTSKCKCSFECALAANVVWNASQYPKMAASAARNVGRT
ncbi:MAG: radical SAM protein [Proteobacteria bacterium]|nr:radical SAM protein [Pseudomonadota bacterium]